MTPEQRLDRAERLIILMAKFGYRARREWRKESRAQNEKINILIDRQIETDELIKSLAVGQVRVNKEMAELAHAQKLFEDSLRAYFDRHDRGRESST